MVNKVIPNSSERQDENMANSTIAKPRRSPIWNRKDNQSYRISAPIGKRLTLLSWKKAVEIMAENANATGDKSKRNDMEILQRNSTIPQMFFTDGRSIGGDAGSPTVVIKTTISPDGDTTTEMKGTATNTTKSSEIIERNGQTYSVTRTKQQNVMVGSRTIVSPIVEVTISGDGKQEHPDAFASLFKDHLDRRRSTSQPSSELALSPVRPMRPASEDPLYQFSQWASSMEEGQQHVGSGEGNTGQLGDEMDLAIQETLQKTMDKFRQMVQHEREELLRLFPQLANSRITALADQAPATEIITEERKEPDGSVVKVQRVVTRQVVKVHKSVSMVNGIVQNSTARAVVEYQGPNGGYRVKLEDTDATVEPCCSETEEDEEADRNSIAPSELSETVSVVAFPSRTTRLSKIRKSASAVVPRGDVVPSLQTSPKRKSEKAWYAAEELVESERRYVEKLRLLDQVFRARIQQDPETAKTIGDDKLKKLFCNIGQLYSFHNDHLLPQLEERLSKWHSCQKICDVVRRLAPFLKIYSEYTNNYTKSTKTFEELMKRNKRFSTIIDKIEKLPECDHLPLSNHIICPIQRVTRYHLLMTEYLRNLHDDHPDKEDTMQALELTKEAAAHANNMMRQLDKYKNVIEVQELLGSQIHELLTPSRELIKQGPLMKISSRNGEHQQRYVFLFSDILLLCSDRRKVVSAWGNKYKLRSVFEVGSMHVLEGDNLEVENTFYVRSGNKTVEFYTESNKVKMEWMEILWSVIQDHHKRMRSFRKRDDKESMVSNSVIVTSASLISSASTSVESQKTPERTPSAGRCPTCSASFNPFRKQHICKECRMGFCKKCCHKIKVKETSKEHRLCTACYEKMKNGNGQAAVTTSPCVSNTNSPEHRESVSPPPANSGGESFDKEPAPPGGTAADASTTQRITRKSILEVKPSDACIVRGELEFKSAGRKWEKRYFALHEDFVFYMFRSEKDDSARTSVPVTGCKTAIVDPRQDPTISSKETSVFKLEHKHRVYYFKTTGPYEMAKWVAALDLASQAQFPVGA